MNVGFASFDLDALALAHKCFSINRWNCNLVPRHYVNEKDALLLVHTQCPPAKPLSHN